MSIEKELWEQKVLQTELETMKQSDRKVYKQQPGSSVFFLSKKADVLASCKLKQSQLANSTANK